MPDWTKVAGKRAENAQKALRLLINTAGPGYDVTEPEAQALFDSIEEALTEAKDAYAERFGSSFADVSPSEQEDYTISTGPIIAEGSLDTNVDANIDGMARLSKEPVLVKNTASDQPIIYPHRTQVKDFINGVDKEEFPSYALPVPC